MLKKRCKAETLVDTRVGANEATLADCLLSESPCIDDSEQPIATAARALDSIAMLRDRAHSSARCITVHRQGKCASFRDPKNPETIVPHIPKLKPKQMMGQDVQRAYETCAVVGNGPGLSGSPPKAAAIDAHDAIFRFNYVHNVSTQGARTTHRVLNNKRARIFFAQKHVRKALALSPKETWLLWNYVSLDLLQPLRKHVNDTRVIHTEFIAHTVDAYFGLRRDLRRLGVPGMGCPSNVSSGLHGILLALALCRRVNVFGFSFSRGMLHLKGQRLKGSKGKETFKSQAHDWGTDVLIIRLLAMAGVLNIC